MVNIMVGVLNTSWTSLYENETVSTPNGTSEGDGKDLVVQILDTIQLSVLVIGLVINFVTLLILIKGMLLANKHNV